MNSDYKDASGYVRFIIDREVTAKKYYGGMDTFNYKQYDNNNNFNPYYYLYLVKNKKALGIPNQIDYISNNLKIFEDFSEDYSVSFKRSLELILNMNLKTLIYNGQNDFVVPTVGVQAYMRTL